MVFVGVAQRSRLQVKIVTSEIDSRVDENFVVVPGVGEFGDRYFCE
jgi:uridine kinase